MSPQANRLPRAALISLGIAVIAGLASLWLPPAAATNPWSEALKTEGEAPTQFRYRRAGSASAASPTATLAHEGRERLSTPGGSVLCDRYALRTDGGVVLQRLWVEAAPRRAIVQVSQTDGGLWVRSQQAPEAPDKKG